MSDPFRPTYFVDFYEKYPADRDAIMELNRDMWAEEEKFNHRKIKYSFVSLGLLTGYTIARGPLPLLSKYGRVFGTHRFIRQFLYTGALSLTFAYLPFKAKLSKTNKVIAKINESRIANGELYVEPTKPISYSHKHY